jgi:hypothetical protein
MSTNSVQEPEGKGALDDKVNPEVDPQGVPADAGMNPEGIQDGDKDTQAQWEAKMKEMQAKHEADIGKIRSSYDRQIHELQSNTNQTLTEAQKMVNDLRMKDMTAEQKVVYREQLLEQERQKLEEERTNFQRTQQQTQLREGALRHYENLGIDRSKLEAIQDYNELVDTGWKLVQSELERLRNGGQPPADPDNKEGPATHVSRQPQTSAGGDTAVVTLEKIAEKEFSGNMEALFKEVEVNPAFAKRMNTIINPPK